MQSARKVQEAPEPLTRTSGKRLTSGSILFGVGIVVVF